MPRRHCKRVIVKSNKWISCQFYCPISTTCSNSEFLCFTIRNIFLLSYTDRKFVKKYYSILSILPKAKKQRLFSALIVLCQWKKSSENNGKIERWQKKFCCFRKSPRRLNFQSWLIISLECDKRQVWLDLESDAYLQVSLKPKMILSRNLTVPYKYR